jgi:hypothetical protein
MKDDGRGKIGEGQKEAEKIRKNDGRDQRSG